METPNPQPWLSQKPGKKLDTTFCSEVIWSVVMTSTDRRDRMRSLPYFPLFSIISPKASRSSTVETSPPDPDSKTGGLAQLLSSTPSKISNSPVEGLVQ